MGHVSKFEQKLLFKRVSPARKFSNDHASYATFGTQVEALSLKISSFPELGGQNCRKVDKYDCSWSYLHFRILGTAQNL